MHVCSFCDGVDYAIRVGAKTFYFEFSDQFGPHVVNKHGREVKEPGLRSPFWRALSLWKLQGKRSANGMCVWHEPRQPVFRVLNGRHKIIVEHGEKGWDW